MSTEGRSLPAQEANGLQGKLAKKIEELGIARAEGASTPARRAAPESALEKTVGQWRATRELRRGDAIGAAHRPAPATILIAKTRTTVYGAEFETSTAVKSRMTQDMPIRIVRNAYLGGQFLRTANAFFAGVLRWLCNRHSEWWRAANARGAL